MVNYNIVTQAGSAALETMEAHPDYATFSDKIQTFDTYDEAILALQGGRADCMVVDQVLGEYKNSKMDGAMQVCDFNFGDDFYAIGFRKGDVESAAKVSGAIQTLIDNGKAAEISEKWFGKNIVILEGYDQ